MMNCFWCGELLNEEHGYDRYGHPICASFSHPPTPAYNACKSRKSRKNKALPVAIAETPEKTELEASTPVLVALQTLVRQLDELILLQRQQPKPVTVVKEEIKTIKTTTEFTPPNDDFDFDIEIKQDTSTKSATNFVEQMKALQAGTGVWGKGKEQ